MSMYNKDLSRENKNESSPVITFEDVKKAAAKGIKRTGKFIFKEDGWFKVGVVACLATGVGILGNAILKNPGIATELIAGIALFSGAGILIRLYDKKAKQKESEERSRRPYSQDTIIINPQDIRYKGKE